jgi:hypothetical protein
MVGASTQFFLKLRKKLVLGCFFLPFNRTIKILQNSLLFTLFKVCFCYDLKIYFLSRTSRECLQIFSVLG